ncbi:type IX secretion system membrane protein, PorP/SprF family [Pustulibacterium marinum]|uniref:Type IX secretion system membrane protein, PorP/SprF family n=1 Tax=Pustulibacterium marinum TaxID=1224947 RepID=A0A1I7HIX3_9FLAO|nr:PorP/SprF family type IX secretion system membrane protein [Pustulibacterium marinum]SFU60710.1 type IX secretion system membrane protein, PorP/SprF family [Pustulibacterium marinum]
MKKNLLITLLFIYAFANAQDPIYTQYYNIPQVINPGATAIRESASAGIIHRSQWPEADLKINSNYAFYNTYSEEMNSALGVNILSQRESFSKYHLTQVNFAYAYRVQLNRNWFFHPAIEVGYGNKSYGFQNLVLGDQLNIDSGTINPTTADPTILNENVGYFDFSAGAIINTDKFWFGITIKHLNRPEIDFTNSKNMRLDMFYSFSGSYTFGFQELPRILPNNTQLLVSANYMQQGSYNRLDVGAGVQFSSITVGAIAATNPSNISDNGITSINPYLSFEYEHFRIGYSYDIVTNGMGRNGGVHEISFVYLFDLIKDCDGCPRYFKPKSKTYLY